MKPKRNETMARYRKKPVEIEAIEFGKEQLPKSVKIYNPPNRNGYAKVYNQLHDSWITLKEGDMIRIDKAPDDVYPIDRETFKQTYEKVE